VPSVVFGRSCCPFSHSCEFLVSDCDMTNDAAEPALCF